MTNLLIDYAGFLLKIITILVAFVFIIALAKPSKRSKQGKIVLTDLSKKFKNDERSLNDFFKSDKELKQQKKQLKIESKQEPKEQKRLFLLEFNGDIVASQVGKLRKEIDAILMLARSQDKVMLKLQSQGGTITDYGLASSQLQRLKDHSINLTIAVDKVAASGGYMMCCLADKIVAAPFAVLGSIGVVAQVPNIHRLLKKLNIDFDVMTAGEFKRTVTVAGENTEKGKQKFQQELEEAHLLFKNFVSKNRPTLAIEQIATGEHWFGIKAIELNLIDEIKTSDDLILDAIKEYQVVKVEFVKKKQLTEKLGKSIKQGALNIISKLQTKFIN